MQNLSTKPFFSCLALGKQNNAMYGRNNMIYEISIENQPTFCNKQWFSNKNFKYQAAKTFQSRHEVSGEKLLD